MPFFRIFVKNMTVWSGQCLCSLRANFSISIVLRGPRSFRSNITNASASEAFMMSRPDPDALTLRHMLDGLKSLAGPAQSPRKDMELIWDPVGLCIRKTS